MNFEESLRCYNEGLNRSPNYDWLLISKGRVLAQHGHTAEAIATFELATLHSDLVWPSLFLARYALDRKDYSEGFTHCLQAWKRVPSDSIKAIISEWMAIAASELLLPEEVIRSLFQEAEKFEPTSNRIKRNREVFESSRGRDTQEVWDVNEEVLDMKWTYEAATQISERAFQIGLVA